MSKGNLASTVINDRLNGSHDRLANCDNRPGTSYSNDRDNRLGSSCDHLTGSGRMTAMSCHSNMVVKNGVIEEKLVSSDSDYFSFNAQENFHYKIFQNRLKICTITTSTEKPPILEHVT